MGFSIIFFVESPSSEQRLMLCRWVEHFHAQKKRIQIVVDSTMAARHLDTMLWTFSDESFIPHRIAERSLTDPLPTEILITVGEVYVRGCEILMADSSVGLDFMKNFSWAVHFVLQDDSEHKQESRILWQRARESGFAVRHIPYAPRPAFPTLER